jgi:hypothetical protein
MVSFFTGIMWRGFLWVPVMADQNVMDGVMAVTLVFSGAVTMNLFILEFASVFLTISKNEDKCGPWSIPHFWQTGCTVPIKRRRDENLAQKKSMERYTDSPSSSAV